VSFQEPKYPVQIAAARGAPSCVPVPCVPAPRAPRAARNPKLLSGGCRAAGGGGGGARGAAGGAWGQPCRRAAQAQRLSASHAVVSVL